VYSSPFVNATFEHNTVCDTAHYTIDSNGSVNVLNGARVGTPDGAVYYIEGYAQHDAGKPAGQFSVHLFGHGAPPFGAPYLIYALGPVVDDEYSWAIVSDQLKATLFVLVRSMDAFKSTYQPVIDAELNTLGFNSFLNKPLPTYQGPDCQYVWEPTPSKLGMVQGSGPVSTLSIPAYIGKWFQVYASPFVNITFEKNTYCDTAHYTLNSNGTVHVLNGARNGGPQGSEYAIEGFAAHEAGKPAGQFGVTLFGHGAPPFAAPYWIYATGPIVNGQYQYAIVSDGLKASLFVLVRSVEAFHTTYQGEIDTLLNNLGFNTIFNKPLPTYQGSDCEYVF
jgi:lipocalin